MTWSETGAESFQYRCVVHSIMFDDAPAAMSHGWSHSDTSVSPGISLKPVPEMTRLCPPASEPGVAEEIVENDYDNTQP